MTAVPNSQRMSIASIITAIVSLRKNMPLPGEAMQVRLKRASRQLAVCPSRTGNVAFVHPHEAVHVVLQMYVHPRVGHGKSALARTRYTYIRRLNREKAVILAVAYICALVCSAITLHIGLTLFGCFCLGSTSKQIMVVRSSTRIYALVALSLPLQGRWMRCASSSCRMRSQRPLTLRPSLSRIESDAYNIALV